MSRIATGWSLTKASWAVLKADRSLVIFPLLSFICAAVACELVAGVGVVISQAVGVPWVVVPFLVAALYAAIFCIVYFNVALAGAARLSIEGRDTKLRDGLAVARQRRGVIAEWALLQLGLGLLISVLGGLLGGGEDGGHSPATSLVTSIAGAAWSVVSFFVIPVLALEGLNPRAALKRSLSLVREHWGEGLAGSVGIGGIVFLVAVLPLMAMSVGADALASSSLSAAAYAVVVVAVVATLALGSALGVIFRVELYRYATEGKLTGRFTQPDIDAAFRRKRGS